MYNVNHKKPVTGFFVWGWKKQRERGMIRARNE
jgi:hypothetical protein